MDIEAVGTKAVALLAKIEWWGERYVDYEVHRRACVYCNGLEEDYPEPGFDPPIKAGHDNDCALLAILREAGLRS